MVALLRAPVITIPTPYNLQASEMRKSENKANEYSRQVETLQRNLIAVMDREMALHKK